MFFFFLLGWLKMLSVRLLASYTLVARATSSVHVHLSNRVYKHPMHVYAQYYTKSATAGHMSRYMHAVMLAVLLWHL